MVTCLFLIKQRYKRHIGETTLQKIQIYIYGSYIRLNHIVHSRVDSKQITLQHHQKSQSSAH